LKPKIEPFIIPPDKLEELKTRLANPNLSEIIKTAMIRDIGACLVCRQMATKIVKYRMSGITKIEKYCDECLERMQKEIEN
jgi:hypothetical protein